MNPVREWLSGKKTYILGIFLLVYLAIQQINGEPAQNEVIYGLLAGMGITIRAGIAKKPTQTRKN